jgi:hypothetical protein
MSGSPVQIRKAALLFTEIKSLGNSQTATIAAADVVAWDDIVALYQNASASDHGLKPFLSKARSDFILFVPGLRVSASTPNVSAKRKSSKS